MGLRFRYKGTNRTDTFSDSTGTPVLDDARLRDTYVRPWFEYRLLSRWKLRALAQLRWSSEKHFDGARDNTLETNHIGGIGTVVWQTFQFLDLELGFAADRVRVDQDAAPDKEAFTHGNRTEGRVVFTVDLHAEGARLILTETLETNNEGYQTVGYHDKGFARLIIEF